MWDEGRDTLRIAKALMNDHDSSTSKFLVDDYEGISYDILSKGDKTVCVARQTATDQLVGDVVIPSQVKYGGTVYTVTEISGWAFSSCNNTSLHSCCFSCNSEISARKDSIVFFFSAIRS